MRPRDYGLITICTVTRLGLDGARYCLACCVRVRARVRARLRVCVCACVRVVLCLCVGVDGFAGGDHLRLLLCHQDGPLK